MGGGANLHFNNLGIEKKKRLALKKKSNKNSMACTLSSFLGRERAEQKKL